MPIAKSVMVMFLVAMTRAMKIVVVGVHAYSVTTVPVMPNASTCRIANLVAR